MVKFQARTLRGETMKIENGRVYKLTPKDLATALAMFINQKQPGSLKEDDRGRIVIIPKEDGLHLTLTIG
jgi:hypothetical protein